jgi:hypothetical protein
MSVFMEETAESITAWMRSCASSVGSVIGDRFGAWMRRLGVGQSAMGPMLVVGLFVLVEYSQEMGLVPDQRPIEQLVATGLDPTLDQGVHARHVNAPEHDLHAGVGEDGIERLRVLAVPVVTYLIFIPASSRSSTRLRAACATHPAPGRAVALRTRTRRVACSIAASTHSLAPVRVRTSKKSIAMIASA